MPAVPPRQSLDIEALATQAPGREWVCSEAQAAKPGHDKHTRNRLPPREGERWGKQAEAKGSRAPGPTGVWGRGPAVEEDTVLGYLLSVPAQVF